MSALEQRDPSQQLVAEVRSQNVREQILAVLPQDVPFASFERAAIRALLTNADLAKADRRSVFRALIDCAYMGLVPDGKHAALVIYGNQAQALPMVAGIITAAASYGWHMRASVAYSNDEFEWSDEPLTLTHRPAGPGTPRGDLAYAYAIAIHQDGRRQQVVFDKAAVEKRKAKARTKNVWNEWTEEMWKKTAAHRLFKELPLDPADQRIRHVVEASDFTPGEQVATMYGPRAALPGPGFAEPPAGTPSGALTEGSPAPRAEGAASPNPGGAGLQQAAAADPLPAAAAPGPEDDAPEIDWPDPDADPDDDEPGPDDDPDALEVAALDAAKHVPATTRWPAGMTLGQIFESGDRGRTYVRWCITSSKDPAAAAAAAAFARVYAAGLYEEALAERAAKANG